MRFISDDIEDQRPVWMSPEEIVDPAKLVSVFCQQFTITDCRFLLWHMLTASLSAENHDSVPGIGEKVYFFENLMPFIEAVFLGAGNDAGIKGDKHAEKSVTNGCNDTENNAEQGSLGAEMINFAGQQTKASKDLNLKKLQKRIRKHSIWYRERINDPSLVISAFFDATSAADFKSELYNVLQACSQDHFYPKNSPADALYFFEKVESMINAAYIIRQRSLRNQTKSDSISKSGNLEHTASMDDPMRILDERAIKAKGTLTRFFEVKSLRQWKEDLYEVCIFSLSNQAAQKWTVFIDTLPIYVHLVDLIEALEDFQIPLDTTQE